MVPLTVTAGAAPWPRPLVVAIGLQLCDATEAMLGTRGVLRGPRSARALAYVAAGRARSVGATQNAAIPDANELLRGNLKGTDVVNQRCARSPCPGEGWKAGVAPDATCAPLTVRAVAALSSSQALWANRGAAHKRIAPMLRLAGCPPMPRLGCGCLAKPPAACQPPHGMAPARRHACTGRALRSCRHPAASAARRWREWLPGRGRDEAARSARTRRQIGPVVAGTRCIGA